LGSSLLLTHVNSWEVKPWTLIKMKMLEENIRVAF